MCWETGPNFSFNLRNCPFCYETRTLGTAYHFLCCLVCRRKVWKSLPLWISDRPICSPVLLSSACRPIWVTWTTIAHRSRLRSKCGLPYDLHAPANTSDNKKIDWFRRRIPPHTPDASCSRICVGWTQSRPQRSSLHLRRVVLREAQKV